MTNRSTSRNRQRGWAGLLVIVIALLIVGFLAKDALMQYMTPGATSARTSTAPADRLRNPGLGDATPDMSSAPAAPTAPMDRARGVEEMVRQRADERAKRMP